MFQPLLQIEINHESYTPSMDPVLRIHPRTHSQQYLKRHRILWKQQANIFSLLLEANPQSPDEPLIPYLDEALLDFTITVTDKQYQNRSDIFREALSRTMYEMEFEFDKSDSQSYSFTPDTDVIEKNSYWRSVKAPSNSSLLAHFQVRLANQIQFDAIEGKPSQLTFRISSRSYVLHYKFVGDPDQLATLLLIDENDNCAFDKNGDSQTGQIFFTSSNPIRLAAISELDIRLYREESNKDPVLVPKAIPVLSLRDITLDKSIHQHPILMRQINLSN